MGGANKAEFEELLRPHLAVSARLAFGLLQDLAEAEPMDMKIRATPPRFAFVRSVNGRRTWSAVAVPDLP